MKLLKRGAEADLYLDERYGMKVINKVRIPKAYRLPKLDFDIRFKRTLREAQIIHDSKLAGIHTPIIYHIDVNKTTIVMEYIEGTRVKEVLDHVFNQEREKLCNNIGVLIGKMHKKGIIHGDLTTSNMIVADDQNIFLIDFGLAEYSFEVEKRGVDIHLMKRALESTHYRVKNGFKAIFQGYAREMGRTVSCEVRKRVQEIAKRGRYTIK